jgi:purine-binding chemotaxis protein CheW
MLIQGGKFLSFLLGEEVYGIPIKSAKEIIGIMGITNIPKMQGYIKGVINLRGKIIPIVDLRLRFGMVEQVYTERTCIIIVETGAIENKHQLGIVVDAVSEVITIQTEDIEAPPEYDMQIEGSFLMGLGKIKEKVVLILEIAQIINREELAGLKQQLNYVQEIA